MAIAWNPDERQTIEDGIARYPAASNQCAALARIVFRTAQPRDERTRGVQLVPVKQLEAARWLIPKKRLPRLWTSHTLVDTQEHRVDALTGADGCPSQAYLSTHFHFHDALEVHDVDVFAIDTWIQEEGG